MGKHSVQIDDTELYNNIVEYCKLNGLKIGNFITELVRKQFMIEQYGDIPFGNLQDEPPKINPPKKEENETVYIPHIIETHNETIGDNNFKEKYKTEAPKEYYTEIKIEPPIKPKKRRL